MTAVNLAPAIDAAVQRLSPSFRPEIGTTAATRRNRRQRRAQRDYNYLLGIVIE